MAFNDNPNVTWTGNSGTVAENGCSFRFHDAGTIARGGTLDADWITSRLSTLQVRSRGQANIVMTSDNKLRLASDNSDTGIVATVDYANGGQNSRVLTQSGGTASVTSGSLSVTGTTSTAAALTTFHAGGSASMTMEGMDGDAGRQTALNRLANDTEYLINHTVTCTQTN